MKLNKLHWLSALLVFALISGFVMRLVMSSNAVPDSQYFIAAQSSETTLKNEIKSDKEILKNINDIFVFTCLLSTDLFSYLQTDFCVIS